MCYDRTTTSLCTRQRKQRSQREKARASCGFRRHPECKGSPRRRRLATSGPCGTAGRAEEQRRPGSAGRARNASRSFRRTRAAAAGTTTHTASPAGPRETGANSGGAASPTSLRPIDRSAMRPSSGRREGPGRRAGPLLHHPRQTKRGIRRRWRGTSPSSRRPASRPS